MNRPHYVQINASASRHADGRYSWTWPGRQVHAHDGLTMLTVALEPGTGRIEDVLWRYAATSFKRLAYLTHGPAGDAEYWIEASPTGHDRFSSHRLAVTDLWERLAPPARVSSEFEIPRRESTRDQGTVYEQLVAADLIRQSRGQFALYRPGMDIAGRDLLVQMVDSWRTIFLQIKGTTQIVRGTRIQCLVKRWTFRPSEDFWLAFYFFDMEVGAFGPYCWLVPSVEFAALTADQHFANDLSFQVTLKDEDNKWRGFRHQISDQAAVLRKALLSLSR